MDAYNFKMLWDNYFEPETIISWLEFNIYFLELTPDECIVALNKEWDLYLSSNEIKHPFDDWDIYRDNKEKFIKSLKAKYSTLKPQQEQTNNGQTTDAQSLNTEPQQVPKQKYFDKAIESGFVEKTDNGYKWVFGGKVRLGYFIAKIYGISERIPYRNIEKLFNVTRLDRTVSQLYEAKKPQKWRIEIDKLIEALD